jgi:UDP-N-acetylmuramate--alanine ligase
VTHCPTPDGLLATLAGRVRPGDLVITLGAGNIWRTGQTLLDQLEKKGSLPDEK